MEAEPVSVGNGMTSDIPFYFSTSFFGDSYGLLSLLCTSASFLCLKTNFLLFYVHTSHHGNLWMAFWVFQLAWPFATSFQQKQPHFLCFYAKFLGSRLRLAELVLILYLYPKGCSLQIKVLLDRVVLRSYIWAGFTIKKYGQK
jgi:hypothetical protein